VVEIAPGVDLQRDVLDRCEFTLRVSPDLTTMSSQLFDPQPGGLTLTAMPAHPRISALSPRQLLVPKQEGTHDAL